MTIKIRQNPAASNGPAGVECPAHGVYTPPPEALQMRLQAVSGALPAGKARHLLEQSERIRRTCPQCAGPAPTRLEWAISVREQTERMCPMCGMRGWCRCG